MSKNKSILKGVQRDNMLEQFRQQLAQSSADAQAIGNNSSHYPSIGGLQEVIGGQMGQQWPTNPWPFDQQHPAVPVDPILQIEALLHNLSEGDQLAIKNILKFYTVPWKEK